MPPKKAQNGDKPKAAPSAKEAKPTKAKASAPVVVEEAKPKKASKADEEKPKKASSKKVSDTPATEPSVAAEDAPDGPVRKGRRSRNPDAQKEAEGEAQPKANGKKRAAEPKTPATASEPKAKKPRSKPAEEPAPKAKKAKAAEEPATKAKKAKAAEEPVPTAKKTKATEEPASTPVLNEREVIASLSDVSDDEEDEEEEDEGNSSDEDEEDDKLAQRSSMASIKLPNSKDDAVVKQRLDKLKKSKKNSKNASTPGTLYVGRLPKGFFEDQMKGYFSQFGDVTRLRVSRNKKTGASKHYAFVEFADKDVANIVQETMNNYLIDGALLQVRTVPKDKIHPEMWIGANRKYRPIPGARLERLKRDRSKTEDEQEVTIQRALNRQEKRKAKLADAGIEYDFPGYTREDATAAAVPEPKADAKSAKKSSSKKAKISA